MEIGCFGDFREITHTITKPLSDHLVTQRAFPNPEATSLTRNLVTTRQEGHIRLSLATNAADIGQGGEELTEQRCRWISRLW